jgi:retron-type reverse transcriptase
MSDRVDISLEAVLSTANMERAWAAVKANAGAGGVDGKGIAETEAHLKRHWPGIREKLLAGDYQPAAVRAVDIAKPGGGTRRLGIPTVQDRLIQQALHQVLSAAFDSTMSEHSWGFRPNRSAHDAVTAARGYVKEGKEWVVDIDLASFFDQVNHDRLMHLLGQRISDKRVMQLIGRYLRAPMDEGNGRHIRRSRGTPQGGPLSPLLANLYLDVLDRELEQRGKAFVRYADDSVPRRRTAGRKPCVQPCCARDEGRPLAAAVQAEAANRPLRLRSRGAVVSELGKGRARPGQVWTVESNVSEPLMRCRKRRNDVETGGSRYPGTSLGATCLLPRRRPA